MCISFSWTLDKNASLLWPSLDKTKHAHFPCELVSRKTNITAAIATSSHIIGFRACLVWNLYSTKFLHITDCPALRVKDKVAERFLRSLKICHWARFQTENKVLPSNLSRYCQNCKTIESYWIPGPVPSLHENNDMPGKLFMCACKLHRQITPFWNLPGKLGLEKSHLTGLPAFGLVAHSITRPKD